MEEMVTRRRTVLARCGAVLAASMARAAEWPDRPIRMILPFGPGSSADVLGRLLAEPLSQRLGQPIVCENHTGTAGSIAAEAVARMVPDGYALLLATIDTQPVNRHLHGRLPYDPERDFTPLSHLPLSHLWNSVNVMAVSADSPWTGVQALIAAGRGRLTFGSPGNGTSDDMASSLFGIPRAAARPGLVAGGLPPEGLVTFTMQEAERYGALIRRLGIPADLRAAGRSPPPPPRRVTERRRRAPAPWNRPWLATAGARSGHRRPRRRRHRPARRCRHCRRSGR
jgi:hypothetical protein